VVKFPELALVRFKVMDRDFGLNQDDFVGQFTVPFESIQSGYRHIHLTASGNPIENATIFLHIEIRDFVAATRGHVSDVTMFFSVYLCAICMIFCLTCASDSHMQTFNLQ